MDTEIKDIDTKKVYLPDLFNDLVKKTMNVANIMMQIQEINGKFDSVIIKQNSSKKRIIYAKIVTQAPKPHTQAEYNEASSYGEVDLRDLLNATVNKEIIFEISFDYLHTDSRKLKKLLKDLNLKKKQE